MREAGWASARRARLASGDGETGTGRLRPLAPAEIAWLALIPCALAMLAAVLVLGPPLGHALFDRGSEALWPPGWWEASGQPEPVRHGRYLLVALAPVVLAGVVLAAARWPPRLAPPAIHAAVAAGQAAVVAVAVVAVLGQRNLILRADRTLPPELSLGVLALAAALTALAVVALRRRGVAARIAALARERRGVRVAALAIAAVFAAAWLVEAVATDGLVEDAGKMNWIPNGAYAVLDGRTPLVDAHIVYSKLLPYPTALVLSAFGATTLTFTLFMALLSLLALLAVYAVLRRLVGSVFALALFLPFVAISDVGHWMRLASIWPMRYGGPYLLAWLTARHVGGARPRHAWILFVVAGLAAIDDIDFGLAALLATVAALACARAPRSLREIRRLAAAALAGTAVAVAAVTLFTLVRAGRPPSLDVLLEYPRLFTRLGLLALPLPRASLHLAIYATLAAAVVVAAVRLARGARDVLLTSMLAWSGVFGLVAGNYYVARPDDLKLETMLSAWGFAIALLTIVCVRALGARAWRAPRPVELLVLFALALCVCTIPRMQSPEALIAQMLEWPAPRYRAVAKSFIARRTHRGEKVAILLPEGWRLAYELGLENVSPYEAENAIVTRGQMRVMLDAMRREGVRMLFTPTPGARVVGDAEAAPEQIELFRRAGFRQVGANAEYSMLAWELARPAR
jgi:hypothetical protein